MKHWKIYSQEAPNLELSDITSQYIVEKLGSCLDAFLGCPTGRTTLIKDTLALLGDETKPGKPHYKIYANRISPHLKPRGGGKFKRREWLYDLHWYEEVEDDNYLPTSLPLVVECEWRSKRNEDSEVPYSGIKFDFQKILVANAKLRLMIFIIEEDKDIIELDDYFNKAIKSYTHLAENSKFLFVAFEKGKRQIRYTEKIKRRRSTNRKHAASE